jgi:integrase
MALSTYLAPRGKRGTYQLRVVVPLRLRVPVGRREFTKSLGTADRHEAERRAIPVLAEWNELLDRAGEQSAGVDTRAVAFEAGFEKLLPRLEEARRRVPDGVNAYRQYTQKRDDELLDLVRRRRDGQLAVWEGIADRTIANRALPLVKGTDEYDEFVIEIADAVIEAVSLDNRRNRGELHAEPRSQAIRDHLGGKGLKAAPGEKVMELFEKYAAQRLLEQRKRPASIDKDRKIITSLAEFVGVDRSLSSLAKGDIRDWIDARAGMPRGYEKMKRYAGMSLRAAAKLAGSQIENRVSAKTLNSYLSAVSAFLCWAIARGHHPGPSPCDALFFEALKGNNPRPPFTTDQLNTILQSPLFTGHAGDGREHESGCVRARDWRFWIPLVCLFTGARVSEIAQLRVADVRQDRGVWLIFIRHDGQAGQSTKSGKSRVVPVHSQLAAIGFLSFCEDRRRSADPTDALFPGAEDSCRPNAGDRASRFWRDYLKNINVKATKIGGDGLGVHSFRHTIADRFREEAELLDNEIAVALGHTVRTVTSGYGKVRQGTVNTLCEMFEAVRFDGVEFDHLLA